MAKPIVSDIRSNPNDRGNSRRSIRVIPLPEREAHEIAESEPLHPTHKTHHESAEMREKEYGHDHDRLPPLRRSPQSVRASRENAFSDEDGSGGSNGTRKKILWGLAAICILILVLVIANVFSGATVTVVAGQQSLSLDLTLSAQKKEGAGDVNYQLIALSEQSSKLVPANSEKIVEKMASGKIVVYNNNSAEPQRLIRNTRFETPEGLIYRIAEPIVVPGKRGTAPGSVEATVFADQPGEKYNIGLTDFTIPGFKSIPSKYKNIYARSKTAMTGGAKGMMKVVREADARAVRDTLNAELKAELLASAASQTPDQFLFFPNASVLHFEQLPDVSKEDGTVELTQKALLTALIVPRDVFAKAVAKKSLPDYLGEPVAVPDASSLTVTLRDVAIGVLDKDPVFLRVKGNATLVWEYDAAALKDALKGKKAAELKQIFAAFEKLTPVKAVIRPFWQKSFPDDVSKIKIVE